MKLTFLGTGTSQGIPVIACNCKVCLSNDSRDKRSRCSALVEINGKNLVIDAGPDFRMQMLKAHVQDIEAVLFTHEHRDHIAGIDDVRPFNFKYDKDIPLYAEDRVLTSIQEAYQYIFKTNYPGLPRLTLNSIKANQSFSIEGIEILPIRIMHGTLPIVGFRFKELVYITDAKYIDTQALDLLKGIKVLILSALHHEEHHSHLTLKESLDMVKLIAPEKAYLIHMSHHMGLHEEINNDLPDNVHLAYDGLSLNI